jgi:hypothetical protein
VSAEQAAGLADALQHLRETERLQRELAERSSLTASREALHEVLTVAIDEAGEALAIDCGRLLRGEGSAGAVRARVAELTGLLDLLDRLAEEAQPGGGAAVDVDGLTGDEGRG